MVSLAQSEIIHAAEQIYATRLRSQLEPAHDGEFVAIEPISGDFFLGKTLSESIQAARRIHPTRLPYVMRVGAESTIHLGSL